jgi:hypothetical protein
LSCRFIIQRYNEFLIIPNIISFFFKLCCQTIWWIPGPRSRKPVKLEAKTRKNQKYDSSNQPLILVGELKPLILLGLQNAKQNHNQLRNSSNFGAIKNPHLLSEGFNQ